MSTTRACIRRTASRRRPEARTRIRPWPRALGGPNQQRPAQDKAELERRRREYQVAQASLDELNWFSDAYNRDPNGQPIASTSDSPRQGKGERRRLDDALPMARPRIERYFPHKGFQTLVLLLFVVMLGVALKGLFLFFQEVLVASLMHLTLFDIPNDFFRRTWRSTSPASAIKAPRN